VRARERILTATVAILERSGLEAVNVAAVAAGAGVSRQTVYAQFGTREELLSQAVTRVMTGVLAEIDAGIGDAPDAAEYVVEAFVAVRQQFRKRAVLGSLLFRDRGSPLFDDDLVARATPVALRFLEPVAAREPGLAARLDDVVELVVRLGVSVLLFDSAAIRSDDGLRAFLRLSLVPVLFPAGQGPPPTTRQGRRTS
jgi:AcrR family transcriptional regulator